MTWRRRLLGYGPVLFTSAAALTACVGSDAETTAAGVSGTRATVAPAPGPLMVRGAPLPLALAAPDSASWQHGQLPGDTLVRLVVRPRSGDPGIARLCSVLATASRAPVDLPYRWPIDSAAPRLAVRFITDGDVRGVRFVQPGVNAQYVFEGLTRDGSRMVSLRWPVTADPAARVPVGAPDSVVEAALRPSVSAIDSTIRALQFATAPTLVWPVEPRGGSPDPAHAVLDDRMLPIHRAALSPACAEATLAVPMIARADHVVKVPVAAGDVVTADANVTGGAVRIHFDESPAPTESGGWQSSPHARIEASQSGQVTLRVRVQVVPRQQAAKQTVLLRIQRSRPRAP